VKQVSPRRQILRASPVFTAGCLVLGVGVGLGPPYLAKAGVQPITITGLALLAAGLVVLALGGVTLVRVVRGWRRILVVPVLLAAIVTALLSIAPAVAVTNVPPTTVGSTTPADRGLAFTEVTLHDAVAATAPRNVLLIAASDRVDEGLAGRCIRSASVDTVDLWIVPRTGHTGALRTHPREWEQRVTTFLATALVPGRPEPTA
jgi:4-amino-4-deoxy-L-arabinose transferase-like glycosyltransferase